jgi:hypothetical protein
MRRRQVRHAANVDNGATFVASRSDEATIHYSPNGLRFVEPYHCWTYTVSSFKSIARDFQTMLEKIAKERWLNRNIYDVLSKEFFPVTSETFKTLMTAERFKINDKILSTRASDCTRQCDRSTRAQRMKIMYSKRATSLSIGLMLTNLTDLLQRMKFKWELFVCRPAFDASLRASRSIRRAQFCKKMQILWL